MNDVATILSLVHEGADRNSATRRFRGRPVLAWTLDRLRRRSRPGPVAVICWEDQLHAVRPVADAGGAHVLAKGERITVPPVEAIAAARRWSDGWRGGLLATCDFDQGFYAPWALEAAEHFGAAAVLLVDPAAALVDPRLLDRVIEHADAHETPELCFAPAAPGLSGAFVRLPLLKRLAEARIHPGRLTHYHPDQHSREPLAGEACVPVPAAVARTTGRFTLCSERQIARATKSLDSLNGQLIASSAEDLVRLMSADDAIGDLPREVTLELNVSRLSRPIYWPGRHHQIRRPDLTLASARQVFNELAEGSDETRVTLAGVGDPLLADEFFAIVDAAASAGLATHVETDLLAADDEIVRRLAASAVDVVSVHLPALTGATYAAVMGIGPESYRRALENIRTFVTARAALGRGVPLIVPIFTKCRDNLGEMEAWYDQWLRALGSAVIVGPSDYCGLVPDIAVADMAPPLRRPCARLASRVTVLSDGRIVSCEQDVLGAQVMGQLGTDSLRDAWERSFGRLRLQNRDKLWDRLPLCGACREWHRA